MRRNRGITLIALTVTIIILLILASVTTYSGISTIQSSKLNKYKQELEIMQSEVNLLYEKYSTEIEAGLEIEIGEELSNSEQENNTFAGAEESDKTGYRVFTKETIESLRIEGVEREYLVNITKKQVISLEPFEQDGKAYFTLAQLSEKNTIEEGIERGEIEFTVETNLSETGLEVTVSDIKYSKYVGKVSILYQKVGSTTWKTLVTDYRENTYTFTLSEVGEYNIKIVDAAGVEKIADTPIIIESGNYLLDNTMYFDTLVEAVSAAKDGSTIKVLEDTEETESVTIDKSITLDMNEKTINYADKNTITINENKNVVIEGKGTLIGGNGTTTGMGNSFIFNKGNLETSNVIINSDTYVGYGNGTVVNVGSFVANNCIIDGIGFDVDSNNGETGRVTINGGEYENIRAENLVINSGTINYTHGGDCIINDGIITELGMNHGTCTINGGIITDLTCNETGSIEITIGNINEEVNNNNPEIQEFNLTGNHFDYSTFYFYNGIVKNMDWYGEFVDPFNVVRNGYKTQITEEGIILVKE